MTTTNRSREAFESDCKRHEIYIGRHPKYPEQYQLYETQLRWMGFQAAWNASRAGRSLVGSDTSIVQLQEVKEDKE